MANHWEAHALFRSALALARYKAQDLDGASAEYEKAVSLPSGRSTCGDVVVGSFHMLGQIYQQPGGKGKAIESYRTFLSFCKNADPGISEAKEARKRLAAPGGA